MENLHEWRENFQRRFGSYEVTDPETIEWICQRTQSAIDGAWGFDRKDLCVANDCQFALEEAECFCLRVEDAKGTYIVVPVI